MGAVAIHTPYNWEQGPYTLPTNDSSPNSPPPPPPPAPKTLTLIEIFLTNLITFLLPRMRTPFYIQGVMTGGLGFSHTTTPTVFTITFFIIPFSHSLIIVTLILMGLTNLKELTVRAEIMSIVHTLALDEGGGNPNTFIRTANQYPPNHYGHQHL